MKKRNNPHKYNQGFSLLEILVVLVIIGIVVTFALLATGNFGQDRKIKAFSQQVAQTISLLEQQAILEPAIIGILVDDNKIQFYRYITDSKHRSKWNLITNDRLLKTLSSQNLAIQISETKTVALTQADKIVPQIIIFPSGEFTPFKIQVGLSDNQMLWSIQGDNQGLITIIKIDS